MIKAEKKVLEYIKLHMPLAVSVLFLMLGIVARIQLRDVISSDYAFFYFPGMKKSEHTVYHNKSGTTTFYISL